MKKITVFIALLAVGMLYAVDPFGVAVSPKSSVIERRSADELQKYLTRITGRKFKRVPVKDARFLIGHDFVKDPSLGDEGFIIRSENGIVRIGGGTSEGRGTFYGVYEYLERCGVRFWTPSEEYIPKVAHDKLPAVNTRQIPSFPLLRFNINVNVGHGRGQHKLNGISSGLWNKGKTAKYRPHIGIITDMQPYNCHTLMYFIPGEKYGKQHPEWFALIKGKRVYTRRPVPGQLCLTNKEMQKEFVKNVKEYLRKNKKPGTLLSISREDNKFSCACENCKAADKAEHINIRKIPGATSAQRFGHTGSYAIFLKYVAEELIKEFPDLKILGSGYLNTGLPPKNIVFPKNVIMDMALTIDTSDPEHDSPDNELILKEIMPLYSKACPGGLTICEYTSTFDNYLYPLPNFEALANRFRYVRKYNTVGVVAIGPHTSRGGGEFNALRNYLLAKLMWNCDTDPWAVAKEFCLGYYGKGGIHLYNYIKWYHDYLLREKKATFNVGGNPAKLYDEFYVAKAKDYFKKAYAESGNDPVLKKRLDHAYVAIDCLDMINRKKAGDNSPARAAAVKKFEESCNRFKINNVSERETMKDFLGNLKIQVPTPPFCKNVPNDKWFTYLPSCWPHWNWCSVVDDPDPNSFSKRPVKMNTDHVSWAVFKKCDQLPGAAIASGTYDAYAYIKVIHQPGAKLNADACKFGWYDMDARQESRVKLKDTPNGKYVYVKLASNFPATLSGSVWMAPLNNPKVVKNFYVDHMVFVKKD